MSKVKKNYLIAVIDDENEWLDIIKDKLLKEYIEGYEIRFFNDFENFSKFEDINLYDVIITDYYFELYSLDSINISNVFKDFKGEKILISGNPNAALKKDYFDRIINKSYLMKPTFKFSKILKLRCPEHND